MTINLREDAPNQVSNVNPDELSKEINTLQEIKHCLLYTSPSPRDGLLSRMPSSA